MDTISNLFRENLFTAEELPAFENKLYYEGDRRRSYLVRYLILLLLSSIIASGGIILDSTATVIRATIIAPLMTPVMATAASFVMGRMDRAIRSLLVVAGGIALVIIVSWLIGNIAAGVISHTTNSQITDRISPRLLLLLVSLASGAAGAFAMSRNDISDSLPGVAISISLLTPLCVVGVSLSDGQWASAFGAFVLFLTSFLSILLAGGGVLALLGLGRVATKTLRGHARRNAFLAVILGILLVCIPLTAASVKIARDTITEFRAARIAEEWVTQSEYEVRKIDARGEELEVIIAGKGTVPETAELVSTLQENISYQLTLDLEIVPMHNEFFEVVPLSN
jgi:uncharacterized hydrophobic protein (TIGR00271 family)